MDRKPSITHVVMFKHGVAYVERSGPAAGSFELSFRVADMNDVLKSLAVWVADGDAKLRSVGFDAPEDANHALELRGLLLATGAALDSMLVSLRGRTIEIDAGGGTVRGEVLGAQERGGPHGESRRSLLLRTGADHLSVVDLAGVRSLRLVEDVSRERLDFLVSRSRAATAGEARAVRVELDGEASDLRVAYVVPAPVWRVSYRVVRDGEQAMLMALGIVHNPVDEDLEDVQLTLTTGQPVSFVIDLYHPRQVTRAVVEEEARAAAAPTRFERARRQKEEEADFDEVTRVAQVMPPPQARAPAPARAMAASLGGAAEGASEAVERGEFFEYRVASRLSIRRGGSAMVPLAATRVPAKRERIWRDAMGPNPDLVLSFVNETGLVLEEGPAVFYDEGVYAGESMLPYSARGVAVKMAFAKDLAVRAVKRMDFRTVEAGVTLEKSGLAVEQRQEARHLVEAENDHGEEVELTVELPKIQGRALAPESAVPVEETASFRRFSMKIPAHGKAELKVIERWLTFRQVKLESMAAVELERWLGDRFLDEATFRSLSGVLGRWQRARDLAEQKKRVEAAQAAAYSKQTKLTEQLNVLKDTGPEGALRLRYVKELEAEQDKVNAAEQEARRLQAEMEAEARAARDEIARLTSP